MDPLTHALLGASASYVAFGERIGPRAAAIGAIAALLPDADILIQSSADPLLAVEHHRGFTHSLLFAPVGGVIAAAPWIRGAIARGVPGATLGAAVLGYVTHGPLDAATSYGTRLLWPFSDQRVGLDWISIIDPLFTLVLGLGLALAFRRASARPAAAALAVCAMYLAVGSAQRGRALETQARISEARGHDLVRGAVFPTFGNNLVWRSIYEAGDSLHLDRIRVGWRSAATSMPTAVIRRGASEVPAVERHQRDLGRFAWFSNGWIARDPADTTLIGDARYSMEMDRWEPVWGIRLHSDGRDPPTEWVDRSSERRIDGRAVRAEVLGRHPAHRPVPERDPR